MGQALNHPTQGAAVLVPKRRFELRKLLAWCLIGPANPVPWIIMIGLDAHVSPFGAVASLTIWPCCLGAAIALSRLKRRQLSETKLLNFTFAWAFRTIPIYMLTIGVWLLIAMPLLSGGIAATDLREQLIILVVAAIMYLPFGFLFGSIPAVIAGACAYLVVRFTLFEPLTPRAATLSQIPAANSAQ